MSERLGFVAIPNPEHEALNRYPLGSEERRIVGVVQRQQYGWNKDKAAISLSLFSRSTGMQRTSCHKAIKRLEKKRIIIVDRSARVSIYSMNSNVREWEIVSRTVYKPHGLQSVSHTADKTVSCTASTYIYRQNRHSLTYRRKKNDPGSHELDQLREAQGAKIDEIEESDQDRLARYQAVFDKMQKNDRHRPTVKRMIHDLKAKIESMELVR